MGSPVNRVDVIGEAENCLRIGVVVLQANLHVNAIAVVFHVNRLVVQRLLAAIEMLDKFRDAAVVLEFVALGLAGFRIGGALIGQRNQQSLVEEREFAQALRQRVVVVFGRSKDRTIGYEVNFRPGLYLGDARLLQLADGLAFGIILLPGCAIAP